MHSAVEPVMLKLVSMLAAQAPCCCKRCLVQMSKRRLMHKHSMHVTGGLSPAYKRQLRGLSKQLTRSGAGQMQVVAVVSPSPMKHRAWAHGVLHA